MSLLRPGLVDEVLGRKAGVLGESASIYRNHVLRGLNYQALLLRETPPDSAVLAWAVHDLGIWTAGTLDYLAPSADLVDEFAGEVGVADVATARAMVLDHHKVRSADNLLSETFRRADLVDVSRGLVRPGLTRAQVREVVNAFPYLGFHRWLAGRLTRYAATHPASPAPMMRW